MDETKDVIKTYILSEFLPGEDPNELTDSTSLVTGGDIGFSGHIKIGCFS